MTAQLKTRTIKYERCEVTDIFAGLITVKSKTKEWVLWERDFPKLRVGDKINLE